MSDRVERWGRVNRQLQTARRLLMPGDVVDMTEWGNADVLVDQGLVVPIDKPVDGQPLTAKAHAPVHEENLSTEDLPLKGGDAQGLPPHETPENKVTDAPVDIDADHGAPAGQPLTGNDEPADDDADGSHVDAGASEDDGAPGTQADTPESAGGAQGAADGDAPSA